MNLGRGQALRVTARVARFTGRFFGGSRLRRALIGRGEGVWITDFMTCLATLPRDQANELLWRVGHVRDGIEWEQTPGHPSSERRGSVLFSVIVAPAQKNDAHPIKVIPWTTSLRFC